VVAVVGWVIFRSSTFTQAKIFLTKMFTFQDFTTKLQLDSKFWVIMIVATIFSFSSATAIGKSIENKIYTEKYNKSTYYVMTGICLVLLLVSISNVVSSGFNPFIYFRF
jgi:alginate O-acetyltransferase complex protein AlgI